ncbi:MULTISPECIES: H-NS family nucleoid-associated regulatory protein [Roseobacteraceae]|jgi:DNA-binding protein H-NS|uniref:Trans-acting regulatory protein HvrA n=1 Tax=Pseudosulfitobacter pseudonitzschiae TaxID=1402135 RepID=A0A221JWX4_9RHOB|nr:MULTISPECIES: H-NS histone family protein [Roseobacteraceae]ASM71241.1 trans-acting regulatory protein HvrA [Pseudosulfitobacter pseudonitzschiae]
MNIDLKTMSHKDLEKLLVDVKAAIKNAQTRDRREARKAAEKAAAEYGFSLEELSGPASSKKAGKAKRPSEPKFANPNDPSQTWTGKGRQPKWYVEAVAGGKKPADLEI